MINSIGREIPDEVLKDGLEPYRGAFYREGYVYQKAAPTVRSAVSPCESKVVASLREAIVKCGLKDGMCISFHHL